MNRPAAPMDKPLTYPGHTRTGSYLFDGHSSPDLDISAGRRLGQARIRWAQETVGGEPTYANLNRYLLEVNAISVDHRFPVMAFGSNASEAQLERKFVGEPTVIPVIGASVRGLAVAYSAHIADYGSIPATLYSMPDMTSPVHVMFVDEGQMDTLVKSEKNYDLRWLDGDTYTLTLDGSGEVLGGCYAFASKHGVLNLGGQPTLMSGIDVGPTNLPDENQAAILEEVLKRWNESHEPQIDDVRSLSNAIREGRLDASQVTRWLVDNVSLKATPGRDAEPIRPYGEIMPTPGQRD